MFHVKKMSAEDFEFASQITDKMNWNLTTEDFAFIKGIEPEGCFVSLDDSKRIGIATTISFGTIGWFGNLIVNEDYRNRGAGSMLVKHSLKYLMNENVRTVGLYAYIDRIPFYSRFGFKYDSEFVVLDGKGLSMSTSAEIRRAENQEMRGIIDFDCVCFGASRKKLLGPILLNPNNICYVSKEKGHIVGYSAAKVYGGMAELGPLMCQRRREDVAVDLLKAVLNDLKRCDLSICIPKKEKAVAEVLRERRFTENFRVARMFYGPAPITDCIYVAESLERG
jgi:GNAT superfamily N-acetyltransferase